MSGRSMRSMRRNRRSRSRTVRSRRSRSRTGRSRRSRRRTGRNRRSRRRTGRNRRSRRRSGRSRIRSARSRRSRRMSRTRISKGIIYLSSPLDAPEDTEVTHNPHNAEWQSEFWHKMTRFIYTSGYLQYLLPNTCNIEKQYLRRTSHHFHR